MLEVTGEANNLASLAAARELYEELIEEVVGGEKPYLSPGELESEHLRLSELALKEFDRTRKMGGEEQSALYRKQLVEEIEETLAQYKAHNESKNIMNVAGTPLTLVFLWVVLYLIAQVAGLVFLGPLLVLANYLQLAVVLSGMVWGVTKYSGRWPEVGQAIDGATASVWDWMVKPLLGKAVQNYVLSK